MKQLLNILKTFGVITGSIATIGGVFWYLDSFQDKIFDRLDDMEYGLGDNTEMVVELQKQAKSNADTLEDIIDHQKKQDEQMESMEGAARFYIRNQKQMTEDAMEDALETILKKKAGTVWTQPMNWSECPIPMNNFWMTYETY